MRDAGDEEDQEQRAHEDLPPEEEYLRRRVAVVGGSGCGLSGIARSARALGEALEALSTLFEGLSHHRVEVQTVWKEELQELHELLHVFLAAKRMRM